MGRCYEFGVSVCVGCEQAMVVVAAGGSCGCPTCGTTCDGRFRACSELLATPGFVPLAAPKWARPGGSGFAPAPTNPLHAVPLGSRRATADVEPVASSAPSELAQIKSDLELFASRQESVLYRLADIDERLLRRDRAIGRRLEDLLRAVDALRAELVAHREGSGAVNEAVVVASTAPDIRRTDGTMPSTDPHESPTAATGSRPQLYEVGGGAIEAQ